MKKKIGFSVAEAMVALAIGGVVLGMSAPLISRHVKNQDYSDAQIRALSAHLVPKGSIIMWSGFNIPD